MNRNTYLLACKKQKIVVAMDILNSLLCKQVISQIARDRNTITTRLLHPLAGNQLFCPTSAYIYMCVCGWSAGRKQIWYRTEATQGRTNISWSLFIGCCPVLKPGRLWRDFLNVSSWDGLPNAFASPSRNIAAGAITYIYASTDKYSVCQNTKN